MVDHRLAPIIERRWNELWRRSWLAPRDRGLGDSRFQRRLDVVLHFRAEARPQPISVDSRLRRVVERLLQEIQDEVDIFFETLARLRHLAKKGGLWDGQAAPSCGPAYKLKPLPGRVFHQVCPIPYVGGDTFKHAPPPILTCG
eukprot:scaffold140151_cov34-Prasinocladus_malaysianus.AAC.1